MPFDLQRPMAPNPYDALPAVPAFSLTSTDFADGQPLGPAQTAGGGSASPQLSWSGFPQSTRSFLVTCFDADAPRGGSWHWLLGDVPVIVTALPSGRPASVLSVLGRAIARPAASVPGAVNLSGSFGLPGFMGALPPKGDRPHRYFFAVHALDVPHLDLPRGRRTRPDAVIAAATPHMIARAVLVGTCQR